MIIGFSSLEGMTHDVYNHLTIGKSDYIHDYDTIVPNNLNAKYKNLLFARIADLIEENYLGTDLRIPRPIKTNMKPYYDLWGDVYINRGVFSAVKNHIKDCAAGSSVYFYLFDLDTRLNIYKKLAPYLHQKFTGKCMLNAILCFQLISTSLHCGYVTESKLQNFSRWAFTI